MDAITGTIGSVAHVAGKNEHSSNFLVKGVFSLLVIGETFHPNSKNHVKVFFTQSGIASDVGPRSRHCLSGCISRRHSLVH